MQNLNEVIKNLKHLMLHREKIGSDGFKDLVGKIISVYPSLGWELGPSPEDDSVDILSLTAGGDRDILFDLQDSNLFPIDTDEWKIVVGIPPRNWERYFFISTGDGSEREVDASKWRYQAFWSDDSVRMRLDADVDGCVDNDLMDEIIRIVLFGELGELNTALFLELLDQDSDKSIGDWKSLGELRKDFSAHISRCHYKKFLSS